MPKKWDRPFTEVELEVMQIIWRLGECTIRQVFEEIPASRDLAYTTVATMMKILEQKGALKSHKKDRVHTFKASVSKVDYEAASLKHLNESLFLGDTSSMVMRLLDNSDLNEDEVQAIKKIINERA